jgi:hypothetical protein
MELANGSKKQSAASEDSGGRISRVKFISYLALVLPALWILLAACGGGGGGGGDGGKKDHP